MSSVDWENCGKLQLKTNIKLLFANLQMLFSTEVELQVVWSCRGLELKGKLGQT